MDRFIGWIQKQEQEGMQEFAVKGDAGEIYVLSVKKISTPNQDIIQSQKNWYGAPPPDRTCPTCRGLGQI